MASRDATCGIKNKSLAKKKISSAPKQFSAIASFPYDKFSGFLRFSQPSCMTFRMVLCTKMEPHQTLCPTKTVCAKMFNSIQTNYVGRGPAWSLTPSSALLKRRAVLGPPAAASKGTEPRPHTAGQGCPYWCVGINPNPPIFFEGLINSHWLSIW